MSTTITIGAKSPVIDMSNSCPSDRNPHPTMWPAGGGVGVIRISAILPSESVVVVEDTVHPVERTEKRPLTRIVPSADSADSILLIPGFILF